MKRLHIETSPARKLVLGTYAQRRKPSRVSMTHIGRRRALAGLLFGRHIKGIRQKIRFVCQTAARSCMIVGGAEKGDLSDRIARRRLSATGANQREQGEDNPPLHRSIIS